MLFSGELYFVFHKFVFRFSEILVVSTFLKSEFFGRVGPVGLGPPPPRPVGSVGPGGPGPGPAGSVGSGPRGRGSGRGPRAGRVGRVGARGAAGWSGLGRRSGA